MERQPPADAFGQRPQGQSEDEGDGAGAAVGEAYGGVDADQGLDQVR